MVSTTFGNKNIRASTFAFDKGITIREFVNNLHSEYPYALGSIIIYSDLGLKITVFKEMYGMYSIVGDQYIVNDIVPTKQILDRQYNRFTLCEIIENRVFDIIVNEPMEDSNE